MPIPKLAASPAILGRDELVDALVRTSFVTMGVLTRIAAEHELSLTQLRVLAILRNRQMSMGDLAAYLGLDRSTISGLVGRAEERGLLQRTPNPLDGRGTYVTLTQDGIEQCAHGANEVAESLAPMTNALTPAETRRLIALLEHMLNPR
jgi:DNA-binding MarR family transcriptional regulator